MTTCVRLGTFILECQEPTKITKFELARSAYLKKLIIVANFVKFGIGMCTMGTSKPRLEKRTLYIENTTNIWFCKQARNC